MAKESNQRLKILYLIKILSENTDEFHHLTMNEIISKLANYGISAERKSVYANIEDLKLFGYDIICEKGKNFGYYMASRDFELPELKLLVDSVSSSRFITEKKSNELIKKLENLTSKFYANELQRQVYTADMAKNLNEKIYYTVDMLHDAITNCKKIAFKYYEYNVNKEKVLKNNGDLYIVSPYSLTFSEGNYYLISHYEKYEGLTQFRVDKMAHLEILDEKIRDIKEVTDEKFNIGDYSKKVFSMYSGKTTDVKLICDNSIINPVIDRFGEDILIRKNDEKTFLANVKINVSPTFYAWIFTFGEKIKISEPEYVKDEFLKIINNVRRNYK
ncbi:MAG: WYL domain-containing transcriptional regulator [Ruminococcaceae bacterium]|nr:WYL domain-containing transcriptional regulator [Oscillospiraceae bacterium]